MSDRIQSFDLLRVFALGMILSCHFSRSIGTTGIDLALGAVGNLIFFAMSGWLLGLAWQRNGRPRLDGRWLWYRAKRLAIPLWVFCIPYFCYLKFSGYDLGIKDVVLNLTLLNWFDRLPGLTPYWFVTAIFAFYLLLFVVTRLQHAYDNRVKILVVSLLVVGIVQLGLMFISIRQGYLLTMFTIALFLFLYANEASEFVCRYSKWGVWAGCLGCGLFLILWHLFAIGSIQTGTTHAYWIALPVAGAFGLALLSVKKLRGGV